MELVEILLFLHLYKLDEFVVVPVTTRATYIKLLSICFVSSDDREFAKLIKEQYTAAHAHHFICKKQ